MSVEQVVLAVQNLQEMLRKEREDKAVLLTALKALEGASTSVGQHLVYNAPTREFSAAIQDARAAIARAEGDA